MFFFCGPPRVWEGTPGVQTASGHMPALFISGIIMVAGVMGFLLGGILLVRPHWVLPATTIYQDQINGIQGENLDQVFSKLDMREQLQHGVSVRSGITVRYVTNFDDALETVQTGQHVMMLMQPWRNCPHVRTQFKNVWDPSFTEACDILVCDLTSPDENGTRLTQHKLHDLFNNPNTGEKQYGTPVTVFVAEGRQVAFSAGAHTSIPPRPEMLSDEAREALMKRTLGAWVKQAKEQVL